MQKINKSKDTHKNVNGTDILLSIPRKAGIAIIKSGAVIACPLLGTDAFIRFCRKRGVSVDRERLIRLERLRVFSPVFRVRTPKKDTPPFCIPVRKENNWFTKKWAWDTTNIPATYKVPDYKDLTQEAYYSIFQIDYLHILLDSLSLKVELDYYLDRTDNIEIDWRNNGASWMQYAKSILHSSHTHEFRPSTALLCQFISNRYFPKTQTNQRMIQVGGAIFSDHWIRIDGYEWNWYDEVQEWDPKKAKHLFNLTPQKLHHAYKSLSIRQKFCDPLENWSQLTQFISLNERKKLKGDALRAETIRAGAHMLRYLYNDLYGEELPNPEEMSGKVIHHIPELEVREDTRRYLELVVNRFELNPQPKVSLIVEGESEEAAVRKIFENYYGAHHGKYGIEIIVLSGVGTATGTKKDDRFRAIFRLIDYLHHHQTITFLMLDNENYAAKLKAAAKKIKSQHSKSRYITRVEYIRIWKDSFEFDNFSCGEISMAMNDLAGDITHFTRNDVIACKISGSSGAALANLYRQKTNYSLPKVQLNEILIDRALSNKSRRKIYNRPIIKVLNRVNHLAVRNPFPTTNETWEINQASKYLGKKNI